jgi:hypothetical protein
LFVKRLISLIAVGIFAILAAGSSMAGTQATPPSADTPCPFWIPLESGGAKITLIYYYQRGVCFALSDETQRAIAAQVFKPLVKPKATKVDYGELVPGVGAFRVRLGDKYKGSVWTGGGTEYFSTSEGKNQPFYDAAEVPHQGWIYVSVDRTRRYAGVIVTGRFKTPEGITEESSFADIVTVYGSPQVMWGLPPAAPGPAPGPHRLLRSMLGSSLHVPWLVVVAGLIALCLVVHKRSRGSASV